jgi:heat shock factor-binding protein 1
MEDFAAPQTTQDLTVFVRRHPSPHAALCACGHSRARLAQVQNLLQQMQGRFATMSDAIIGRIDEMGHRIDELENSIGELMAQVRDARRPR